MRSAGFEHASCDARCILIQEKKRSKLVTEKKLIPLAVPDVRKEEIQVIIVR